MIVNHRREQRQTTRSQYVLCWKTDVGLSVSESAQGIDISQSGIRVVVATNIRSGTEIILQEVGRSQSRYGQVRHCSPNRNRFVVGIQFHEEDPSSRLSSSPETHDINYYEFLQISPKADTATIQRVYRIIAARFHPDNPETGDQEKFFILQEAHQTLLDPERRAAYDAKLQSAESKPRPIFQLKEFVTGVEGEVNRRLGILSILYNRRRTCPQSPGISIFDVEKMMSFPREMLDFTIWYLRSRQYITFADNSEMALTAAGVDFVEEKVGHIPMLDLLLNSGPQSATSAKAPKSPHHMAAISGPMEESLEDRNRDKNSEIQ